MSKKAKLGRGQLHSRSERSWRDETNPNGTTAAPDQLEPATDTGVEPGRQGIEASEEGGPIDQTTSTDGPGGGGATEWPGRAKHHEGLHGGPSRRK